MIHWYFKVLITDNLIIKIQTHHYKMQNNIKIKAKDTNKTRNLKKKHTSPKHINIGKLHVSKKYKNNLLTFCQIHKSSKNYISC